MKISFRDGMFDFNGQTYSKDAVLDALTGISPLRTICICNCVVTPALLRFVIKSRSGSIIVRSGPAQADDWDDVFLPRAPVAERRRGRQRKENLQ